MINRLLIIIVLCTIIFLNYGLSFSAQKKESPSVYAQDHQVYVSDELVIKHLPDMKVEKFTSLNKMQGATVLEGDTLSGLYRIKVSKSVEKAIVYQSHPEIEYAQPNYIFAEAGQEFITLFDLALTIQRFIPVLRQRYTQQKFKEELLHTLLNDKLYYKAAMEEELQTRPEVQMEINEAIEKTLASHYLKNIQAGTPTEEELKNYYKKNIVKYQVSDQIRGQRILLKNRQEAEETLKLLKAGSDFGSLARERSIEPSGKTGGAFGWLGRGTLPSTVEKEIFSLQKNEISKIVELESGYIIIKIKDKRAARQVPFSTVKNKIKKQLYAKRQKEAVNKKTQELKEKYRVKLHLDFLSELKVPEAEKSIMNDVGGLQELQDYFKKMMERP
jgi:parvulin-like peptidyl-prolyl isomerase